MQNFIHSILALIISTFILPTAQAADRTVIFKFQRNVLGGLGAPGGKNWTRCARIDVRNEIGAVLFAADTPEMDRKRCFDFYFRLSTDGVLTDSLGRSYSSFPVFFQRPGMQLIKANSGGVAQKFFIDNDGALAVVSSTHRLGFYSGILAMFPNADSGSLKPAFITQFPIKFQIPLSLQPAFSKYPIKDTHCMSPNPVNGNIFAQRGDGGRCVNEAFYSVSADGRLTDSTGKLKVQSLLVGSGKSNAKFSIDADKLFVDLDGRMLTIENERVVVRPTPAVPVYVKKI